ncbi:MAG TPA: T9SS type B sorting domain-containing protein [Bacteroidetes bacterium]|nr:T9SS type B sorting domain-containing protein [Bacteroidota bacterium]
MKIFAFKKLLLLLLLGLPRFLSAQIWMEDFNSYGDGTIDASPKWTSFATDCDDGGLINIGPGAAQWGVWGGQFTVNDTEGAPCCPTTGGGGNGNYFTTEIIDISDYCDVSISMDVLAVGVFECNFPSPTFACTGPGDSGHDQIVAEYNLDGAGFVQFAYVCGDMGVGVLSVTGLNGSTLQIQFSAANKSNNEFYYIDNIVVNGDLGGEPSFAQIGPLCETDPPVALPSVSLDGVTGTWDVGPTFDPSGLGGTTTTITFTPSVGCAQPTDMDIQVDAIQTPMPTPIGPFCSDDLPVALDPSPGGVSGTWSGPGVTANVFDPSAAVGMNVLTFTPIAGQCANGTTMNVTVTLVATPNLATADLCDNEPPLDLSTLLDPNFVLGTWSGTGVTGTTFDPTGLSGAVMLTFTSSEPCVAPATTTINVTAGSTVLLTTAMVCSGDPMFDLNFLFIGPPSAGTWSGDGVTGTAFDPAGLSGPVSITFTSSLPCTPPVVTTIDVTPSESLDLQTTEMCANGLPFDLTALADPAHPNGIWSGPGVAHPLFLPAGLSGDVVVTFTPLENCVFTDSTIITIIGTDSLSLDSAEVCETSGLFDLQMLADPQYPDGTWSGTGVAGNTFDPSAAFGEVVLLFTPDDECIDFGITHITVDSAATLQLLTDTLCSNEGLFDLTGLVDTLYPTGVWTGTGVIANFFDPTGLQGNVVLTFDPDSICVNTDSTELLIAQSATPDLLTASMCSTDDPLDLNTLEDVNFPTGTWSGNGVTGEQFDPAGMSGNVQLMFTPADPCAEAAFTTVQVSAAQTPALGTAEICETAGVYNLNLLLDANFPAGTWSGAGVVNGNEFDPSGLPGMNTVTFTPSAACVEPADATINVLELASPALGMAAVCEASNNFDLTSIQDVNFPNGNWTGMGVVNGNEFDPSGLSGSITLTFAPTGLCTQASSTQVSVNAAPTITNLLEDCDQNGLDYTVSFDIVGGDPATYTVNGNGQANSSFTSPPISSGTVYSFEIDDANGCGPTEVTGSLNCNCETNAGTMDLSVSPVFVCEGEGFSVVHNGDEFLQPDDALIFVLHDNSGTQLGNIIASQTSTVFPFPSGIVLGDTYYVSAVAANSDGSGGVDMNDLCRSVAAGVPVVFYQLSGSLNVGGDICSGDCVDVSMSFSGIAPFTAIYSFEFLGNAVDVPFTVFGNDTSILFCPSTVGITSGTIDFSLTNLTDANCTVNFQNPEIQSVTLLPTVSTTLDDRLCEGEGVLVNGIFYDQANPAGTEVFPGGSFTGCDSMVVVDLSFFPPAVFDLSQTLCDGGEVVVNGNVYNAGFPAGTEVLVGQSYTGCDSTVNIDLTFDNTVIFLFDPSLCEGESVVVNGTTYDEGMPNGQELFPMGSALGCDSLVVVALDFVQTPVFNLEQSLCTGTSIMVNGTVYDENTPTGTEVLEGQNYLGCDSIVIINLSFDDAVVFDLTQTICEGETITVNGNLYGAGNPTTGQELVQNGSVNGCDSIINIDLSFFPPAEFDLTEALCVGGSITVNGMVYDGSNPSGTEVIAGGSSTGCDSVVNVSLSFVNEVVIDLIGTFCEGFSVNVNGVDYDAGNPTGQEIFANGSVNGCDSIVNINLSFYPPSTSVFEQALCTGGSVVINNTTYDESNPSGVEVLMGASFNGCDSTVFVDLEFADVVEFDLNDMLCGGDSVIVNGTAYNEGNPSGQELFVNGSVNGCDSLVNINLTFLPAGELLIDDILQAGGSLLVNGTLYDENNPSGTEIIPNGNFNGCDSIITVNLTFSGGLSANISTVPPTCFGDADASIAIESLTGGTGPYQVSVNSFPVGSFDDFPAIIGTDFLAGAYDILIEDAAGLTYTDEVEIMDAPEIFLDLGNDEEIQLGDDLIISPQTNIVVNSLVWSPPAYIISDSTELQITVAPTEEITYTLTVFDDKDCSASDDITINIFKKNEVFVPNAFSPNGDGLNDRLIVFGGKSVKNIKSFMIFERWGAVVFEGFNLQPNNTELGWDGTAKGKPLDPAVFVWFAEVEMVDGSVAFYEGDVVLIK